MNKQKGNPAPTTVHRGEVIWFDEGKGFGFIRPDDGSPDVYAHYTAITNKMSRRNLQPGQRVEYEVEDIGKGPKALAITIV